MKRLPTGPRACLRVILLVGALTLAFGPTWAQATGQVGEEAPDFSLVNSQGNTVDVVFGQGDVYLLVFIGFS